jgi:hypothetical protein
MPTSSLTLDQIVKRGQEIYDQQIRAMVEPEHNGKLLVINVETGEYEMDADAVAAAKRAKARFPDAPLFTVRVGHATAYRLGSRSAVHSSECPSSTEVA